MGAIGSNLAETLVRGGAKRIGLFDFDAVMPENVCRSKYSFKQSGDFKVNALAERLISISPYFEIVGVGKQRWFGKYLEGTDAYQMQKIFFNQFDFIFNCTADNEITYLIEQMQFRATVFDISISNGAKALVCATGQNIPVQIDLLYKGEETSEIDAYHPPGCFNPTFRASYNDVSLLLSYALKQINKRLENKLPLNSFKLKVIENDLGFEIKYVSV